MKLAYMRANLEQQGILQMSPPKYLLDFNMSLFMSGNIFTQNRWVGGKILPSGFRSQDSYEKYRGVSQFISFAFRKNMLIPLHLSTFPNAVGPSSNNIKKNKRFIIVVLSLQLELVMNHQHRSQVSQKVWRPCRDLSSLHSPSEIFYPVPVSYHLGRPFWALIVVFF